MAASSSTLFCLPPFYRSLHLHNSNHETAILASPFGHRFQSLPPLAPNQAYNHRKPRNYPNDAVVVFPDPRIWVAEEEDDDEDDEEEEDDRSLDLLVKFIENVFRKISRRARKAVRSVLPSSFSSKLVRFSVNGVLILAFLWILKAFLEVVCTMGSMVFVSILSVRGVWSGISYIRERQYHQYINRTDNNGNNSAWNGTQPAT